MKGKGGGKQGRSPGAAMAQYEPPKPEVLTREGLHRRLDELLEMSEFSKDDSYSPVILPKWKYDNLLFRSEQLDELREEQMRQYKQSTQNLQELLTGLSNPAQKAAPKKSPAICLVTDEFKAFSKTKKGKGKENHHERSR